MTLLLVAGQLWRQIPSTGGWWTLEDCGPGLYRYAYSDDPTRDVLAPAGNGRVDSVRPQTRREEPEALESALGPAGRASQGKDTTKP
jgi:hypothetical protein